jgi:hypothetical protein
VTTTGSNTGGVFWGSEAAGWFDFDGSSCLSPEHEDKRSTSALAIILLFRIESTPVVGASHLNQDQLVRGLLDYIAPQGTHNR